MLQARLGAHPVRAAAGGAAASRTERRRQHWPGGESEDSGFIIEIVLYWRQAGGADLAELPLWAAPEGGMGGGGRGKTKN